MKLKIIINSLVLLFITIIIALFLSQFIVSESKEDIIYTVNHMKPNSIDVVIVGPSTSKAFSPLLAWKRYGITTLNCSFGHLSGPLVKNMIIECTKKQKPKVILINIDAFLYNNKGLLQNNRYSSINTLAYYFFPKVKWSLNKISILKNLIKYYDFNIEDTICFLFPIISTHGLSLDTSKELFLAPKYSSFFTKNDINSNARRQMLNAHKDKNFYTMESIEDLFDFCNKLDVPIIFFSVVQPVIFTKPYITNNTAKRYSSLDTLFKENGFDYINTNDYYTIRDLKFSYEDSYDGYHLNYWGSAKYTSYIIERLIEKCKFEDKRNNPDYSFWNNEAKQYIKYVKDNFDIDISL